MDQEVFRRDCAAEEEAGKGFYLLSKSFTENWVNYVWQSTAAGIITIVMLFVFSELIALIILASIGSTFFTVFALPHNRTAKARNVLGSYLICIAVGLACSCLPSVSIAGGAAVGIGSFGMVITDTEHPPAAGIALGLATIPFIEYAYAGAVFAAIGALFAAVLRQLLCPWLKDLV